MLSYFSSYKKSLRIGRLNTCEIQVDDHLLSKFQAQISFTDDKEWVLTDGFNNKPSTNGTWYYLPLLIRLYLSEEQTIYNEMVFRALQTLFQVEVISL